MLIVLENLLIAFLTSEASNIGIAIQDSAPAHWPEGAQGTQGAYSLQSLATGNILTRLHLQYS